MAKEYPASLILQLPCSPGLGTSEELELRHDIEHMMEKYFEVDPIGTVDGGDIGSGSMNIFLFIEPEAKERVVAAIVQVLDAWQLTERAVVAYAPDAEAAPTVVWPPGYTGTFSVL